MNQFDEAYDNVIVWTDPEGIHRSLTQHEVDDIRAMAEAITPRFGGHALDPDADAPWEAHHPVAREVWERRGLRPKGVR